MSRMLSLIIIALIVATGYFSIRYFKDSFNTTEGTSPMVESAAMVPAPKYHDWHEFKSSIGKFKVLLPVLPQHATEKLQDPKTKQIRDYDMYVSENSDGSIFMISLITILESKGSEDLSDENLLTAVMNDMLSSNPKNTLDSKKMDTFHGHKALNFTISNNELHIYTKTFFIGRTIYILTAIAKNEQKNRPDYEFFVNSFDLIEGLPQTSTTPSTSLLPSPKPSTTNPIKNEPKP